MLKRPRVGRRGWVRTLTVLTAVVGLGLSVVMGALLTRGQRVAREQEFVHSSDLVNAAVIKQTGLYVDTLRTVAAATGAFMTLTPDKFHQITEPLQGMRLAGATSVVFLVPATDEQIPAVQSLWRSQGADGLVLKPTESGTEHLFTIFSTPLSLGGRTAAAGTDVAQALAPSEAMLEARATGQVTVSDTYHLIVDKNLPADRQQMSFVLVAPVLEPPTAQGRRAFRGWVLMGIRGQDFMGATLKDISQNRLDVALRTQNGDRTVVTVADLRMPSTGERDLRRVLQVDVANRQWQLDIQAHATNLPGTGSGLAIAVTVGGSLLALALAAVIYLLATGRDRAQAVAEAATTDLREQKGLLEAIMDSVSAGIIVVDDRGEFILTNPAAAPYLRVNGRNLTNSRWHLHTQLFHSDGVTPFSAADLPMARALSGESSHGVEIIARSPRSADIVFHAGARPLDHRAGRAGAVAVFYDITARKQAEDELTLAAANLSKELALRESTEVELRAREAELSAFAGVVAHDLKAPLRSVAGFTRILQDDLATSLPEGLNPACLHSMDRIVTAAQRMTQLIDDLLAFATARDRALNRQPVDLQELVAEIVTERTSHLPAEGNPQEIPTFDIGTLPGVEADPVMCRQLLDNLIGNALKYTLPGLPAHVQVRARHEPGYRVRVEIIDNGVGIPHDKHEDVFTAFQRAHTGYAGTGLGLAICQRVVERHGGTIGVSDNPGGGSRFHFTLPSGVASVEESLTWDVGTASADPAEPAAAWTSTGG
jgi:signal transduction histidine kinase/CHASE1-domain containing sensor protein